MDIKTLEIGGFLAAFEALRLPYGLTVRSTITKTRDAYDEGISFFSDRYGIMIDERDLKLLQTLMKRGDEHAKVLRGITVWAKVKAPLYFWSEMETYVVGRQRLASESTMHIDCRGLSGEELVKVKEEIPSGHELAKIDYYSYQTLRRIYFQRRNHRLPVWHEFTQWIETLPLASVLITNDFKAQ